ncbi:MAG: hypothetical protein GY804_05665 [Alphaproteobacteria bacterium]|nr:hypothetical protein [Alphaproteobacteria bacterium]
MIRDTKKALSLTLKVIAILFVVMLVLLAMIHSQIQRSTKEKVVGYLDDTGMSSHLKYKNIGKGYFPPAININDVKISKSFGCFDNSIASVVIKKGGGMKFKGVHFDVLDAVKCRFPKEKHADFANYMKSYKPGWDTLGYPWLSLMLAGYRDINSDIEINFSNHDGALSKESIKKFQMKFFVKNALDLSFDVLYLDDGENTIEKLKQQFFDSSANNGDISIGGLEALLSSFARVAKISSVSIDYKDHGFIGKYRVFADRLAFDVPDGGISGMDTNYVVKFGVLRVIQDMLESGLSLDMAEKIETSLKSFINSPDELFVYSNNEKPISIKGATWKEMLASYIVDAKVEFSVK